MKIKTILNNNAVICTDNGVEKIVVGSGIAFEKKKNDILPKNKIEKVFVLNDESEPFRELLKSLPEEYVIIVEDIIKYAELKLQHTFQHQTRITLIDHISFAVKRFRDGVPIHNRLLSEIKVLYPQEYEIGLWAVYRIKSATEVELPEDEAGYIALHIHTAALNQTSVDQPIKRTTIIQQVSDIIASELDITIEKKGITYHRLLTHLTYVITRLENNEPLHDMDLDLLALIKNKYEQAFLCSSRIARFLHQEYDVTMTPSEVGYLAIHIQRIIDNG
ncbi:PRD domain-containing protein [Terribacillus saccharophilus]|uniref:PRD domain-containing protein n=1 Tax=Terribacillus saccharophilus TaxID=361277 RepID=UPI002DCA0A2C|nr:PRD domain-containing protein [Terribacillus saccharophilus]MEC0289461.1 PRD domain-containing protein [Terribacillus saccharophilus]